MKTEKSKFIKKGIAFLVILMFILLVLNLGYIEHVQNKKHIFRKEVIYEQYFSGKKEIEFAFFGDSHTRDIINPLYLEDSFNFAGSAEDYTEIYYKLKKILEVDKVRVGNIILCVDLHSFSEKMKNNRFEELGVYSNYVSLKTISKLKDRSLISIYLELFFPVIGNGKDYISSMLTPRLEIYLGWTNQTTDFSLGTPKVKERIRGQFYGDYAGEIDSMSLTFFLKTLKLAKENNINIILVRYPVSEEYLRAFNELNVSEEKYYNIIFKFVDEVLGDDYIFLDKHDLFFGHPEYFRDPDHTNYNGSRIFSENFESFLQ